MSNRKVLIRSGLILILTVTAMACYGDRGKPNQNSPTGRTDLQQETLGAGVLRIREDARRNRLWVLTLDEVRVYDIAQQKKQLIRKTALPSWSVVGFRHVCMPDMALDRTGSAFISSNGQARLLRIDANSFDAKDYAISFHQRGGLDMGFGALAFAADGSLFARTTPGDCCGKLTSPKQVPS